MATAKTEKTASQAYQAREKEALDLLERIKAAIEDGTPTEPDWADVGSLTYCTEQLQTIAKHLGATN